MDKMLSIIIPHHNSPASLTALLETIPDDPCLEIIVVDDHSRAENVSQVRSYIDQRKKQCSIHLYRNASNHRGAGAGRNTGLDHAAGKWLLFADADDLFVGNWLELVKREFHSGSDIIYYVPTSMNASTKKVSNRHVLYEKLVRNYAKTHSHQAELELKYCFCTPWSKLIRKNLVQQYGLQYEEVIASNDVMFVTKCAWFSSGIKAVDDIIYCVTRSGTSMTAQKDIDQFMSRVYVTVRRYQFLENHLCRKDFKMVHIDRYAFGKLVDVILEGWGIKTLTEILKLYRREHIAIWDLGLFNPVTLWEKARMELAWWVEIQKNR